MSMQVMDTYEIELDKDIPLLTRCGITLSRRIRDLDNRHAKRIRESIAELEKGRQAVVFLNGTCLIFGSIYGLDENGAGKQDFPSTPVQSIEKVATSRVFRLVGLERDKLVKCKKACTLMLANLVGGGKAYFVFD